jgi:hypothetical protein
VIFTVKSKKIGTYVSEVTNVTHASYTYDASANVEVETFLQIGDSISIGDAN